MLRGGRLYLVTGVALASLAVVLALVALQRQRSPTPAVETVTPEVPVVVAARDIRAGTVLTLDDVAVVQANPDSVAPGTAQQPDQVIGLVAAGDLVAGQRILFANLVTPSLSNLLQPGKRAVALPVDRINAIGGFVRPNDLVDLVYAGRVDLLRILPTEPLEMADGGQGFSPPPETITLPAPGATGRSYPYPGVPGSRVVITDTGEGHPVAKIVLQNLRVLEVLAGTTVVSGSISDAQQGGSTATERSAETSVVGALPPVDLLIVEADPEQAELITFLLDQNIRYQVILRARGDTQEVETDGVTYDRLVGEYGLPLPAPVTVGGPQ